MDNLYSNVATHFLKDFRDKTKNPNPDAKVSFTPMTGYCQEQSEKAVLSLVRAKINLLSLADDELKE